MTQPDLSLRQGSRQKVLRLAAAIMAAVCAVLAVGHALAWVIQKRSPELAHALAPRTGFITAELSTKVLGAEATVQSQAEAGRLARLALRQDPTAIDAAAVLGIIAQMRGNKTSARARFGYVQALSRRNIPTQLWEIGDAIERNDLPAILTHYDIALRTSPAESPMLYRTLMMMIGDPKFRAELGKTLARKPVWASNFLSYIVSNSTDPALTVALLRTVKHSGGVVLDRDSASIINAMIAMNRTDEAWTYYSEIHPGVLRRMSRDPHFQVVTQTPSSFDWTPANVGGISVAIQSDGVHGGALTFAAPPSVGGRVVGQIELLPPGRYDLSGHSTGIEQTEEASPYWSLVCADGRELGRVDLPNSSLSNGVFHGSFFVPADCPKQVLALEIRPSSDPSGVLGQIDSASLRPAE